MENRHGLVVDACVVPATGTGERDAAASLIAHCRRGADHRRRQRIRYARVRRDGARAGRHAAHAQKARSRTLDRRTTRHAGYLVSQRVRKRIEEVFGWMKTVGGMRKLKHRGGERVNWQFLFTAAAYNLVRMRTLMTTA